MSRRNIIQAALPRSPSLDSADVRFVSQFENQLEPGHGVSAIELPTGSTPRTSRKYLGTS